MMKPGDCDRCVSLRERIAELEAANLRLQEALAADPTDQSARIEELETAAQLLDEQPIPTKDRMIMFVCPNCDAEITFGN